MRLLPDMSCQICGFGQDASQECMCFGLFDGGKSLHRSTSTDDTMEETTETTETVTIREENEGILVTDEIASHLEDGPIGIDGTLLIKHIECGFGRVEDNDRLSEDGDGTNVS